jgi:hypothetical protein
MLGHSLCILSKWPLMCEASVPGKAINSQPGGLSLLTCYNPKLIVTPTKGELKHALTVSTVQDPFFTLLMLHTRILVHGRWKSPTSKWMWDKFHIESMAEPKSRSCCINFSIYTRGFVIYDITVGWGHSHIHGCYSFIHEAWNVTHDLLSNKYSFTTLV